MKKILLSLLTVALILGFGACIKPEIDPIDELPVSASLVRNVDYTIRGTKRDTVYTEVDKILTGASYGFKSLQDKETNTFYVSIDASPRVLNTYGESVTFVVDKTMVNPGFVGVYNTGSQGAIPLYDILYAYSLKLDNGISSNLHSVRTGLQMSGELKIESYDPVRRIISGSYTITANLDQDPLKMTRQIEFNDKCKLTVSGTFKNIKVRWN